MNFSDIELKSLHWLVANLSLATKIHYIHVHFLNLKVRLFGQDRGQKSVKMHLEQTDQQ